MLFKRTISSLLLIAILIITIAFSKGSMAFAVLLFSNIIVAFGLFDFMYITNRNGSKLLRTYGVVAGVVLNTVLFFSCFFNRPVNDLLVAATVVILAGMFLIQLIRQDVRLSIHGICTTITGILYVVWLFSFLLRINYMQDLDGRWLICVVLFITKSGDIFAYLIGSNFGKHKLIAKISPGKTVEGSIGGIIGSLVVALIIVRITPVPEIMVRDAWILGLVLGFFSQLGDLAESMIKRNGDVKDSGEYIPGMGGVLDLLDSILFTAPIMYYYMRYSVGVS